MTTINEPRSIVMILFWATEIAITIMILLSTFGRAGLGKNESPVMLFLCHKLMFDDRTVNWLAFSGLILPIMFCGFIFMDSVMCQAFREISRESQVAVLKSCVLGAIPIVAIGLIPFVIGRRLIRRN